jgi:hypothetical protein
MKLPLITYHHHEQSFRMDGRLITRGRAQSLWMAGKGTWSRAATAEMELQMAQWQLVLDREHERVCERNRQRTRNREEAANQDAHS